MKKRLLSMGPWMGLGILVGLLSGSASALFLALLFKATDYRIAQPMIIWALPVAGLAMGWVYRSFGEETLPGNNLILERLHSGGAQVPLRMAPMILLGTVWTHLFGGSAGREGTGVQMGASLADGLAHALKLQPTLRRHVLAAGVAGGFASVFGTPMAGAIFGMEVIVVGRMDYEALFPVLIAALVGDWTTRAWGIEHAAFPVLDPTTLTGLLALKWMIFGGLLALTAWAFIELTHAIKAWSHKHLPSLPWRMALGGAIVVALWQCFGLGDYLGLSTPLISQAFGPVAPPPWSFAAKLLLTAVTLGFGFVGGEVTPLMVVGACLGSAAAVLLGLPGPLAVGVGFVALFGAAANTPLAMIVMAVELLGPGILPHVALTVVVAYLLTGQRSIYSGQKWWRPKHEIDPPVAPLVPAPLKKPALRRKRA